MAKAAASRTKTQKGARGAPPRLMARLIGVDRIKGMFRASGWVSGDAPNACVAVRLEGDQEPETRVVVSQTVGSDRRLWSVERPIPRALGPKAWATIMLEVAGGGVDEIGLELELAQDVTEPTLAVSRVVADPATDHVIVNGWAYHPGGGLSVEASLDGVPVGSAPVAMKRPDLVAARPLLTQSTLGWMLELEAPGLAERLAREPPPQLVLRLVGKRFAAASRSAVIEYAGDLDAAVRRRELLKKTRSWAADAPTVILDGLLASRAFRRRWGSDPAGDAFAARRIVVDELIRRDAVTGERTICLSNGDLVLADPGRDRVMARAFLLKGAYERGFTAWVETMVKPGDVAIDVGAAYGVVSLAMARCGARVFAVEANPKMADVVARNCALNGARIEIIRKAASDRPGTATFASAGAHNVGSSKIVGDASASEAKRFIEEINGLSIISLNDDEGARERPLTTNDVVVETVQTTTLDDICELYRLNDVALVKLDIEGAELIAIRGAQRLVDGAFGRPPIVTLEFSRLVPVIDGTPEDVFAFFADRGWTIHVQQGGKNDGGPLRRLVDASAAPIHDNIICLPPGRLPTALA